MKSKNNKTSKKISNPNKKTEKKPHNKSKYPILRPDNFQKTYGTRVLVMKTEYDFRAIFANEKMIDDEGQEFLIGETMVILTPIAAKELYKELNKQIREWEHEHGTIKKRVEESVYTEQLID